MSNVQIGRYELVSELGRGGMGTVYRGFDPLLDREVAVKVLPPKKLTSDMVDRFLREARAQAKLVDSANIVKIHDIGKQTDGEHDIHYIVMEFVPGKTLGDHFPEGPPQSREDLAQRLEIFEQLLVAMDYAHSKGVVHRDLKPDNVMVSKEGRAKVMDFGLAFFAGSHSLTKVNQVMGTVAYFSPEQAKAAKNLDHRADIYSLGVILYELLTGVLPFTAEHALDMMRKLLSEPPRDMRKLNPNLSPRLIEICLKCLEKEPALRYKSAGAIKEALHGLAVSPKAATPKKVSGQAEPTAPVKPTVPPTPKSVSAAPSAPSADPNRASDRESTPTVAGAIQKAYETTDDLADASSLLATAIDGVESGSHEPVKPAVASPSRSVKTLHPSLASTDWRHRVDEQSGEDSRESAEFESALDVAVAPVIGPVIHCHCGAENPPGRALCLECDEEIKPSYYIIRGEAETHYASALKSLSRGHFHEARDELLRAVDKNPEFGDAFLELGRTELSLGMFKDAHDHLDLALEFLDDRYEPLLSLADLYQQVEQPEDVVVCLQDMLADRPNETDLRCRLALLYCQLGETKKAISTYRTALKHDPNHVSTNRQLGLLLASDGRDDEAIYYLEIVCQLDPRDGYTRGVLGKLYANSGRLKQAEEVVREALEIRRDDPDLRAELGELHYKQGRFDKAAHQLQKTLTKEGGHLAASQLLGTLYAEHGDVNRAVDVLAKAAKYHPEDDLLQRKLGEVYLIQGDLDRAMDCFERVVALRPDCAEMRNKLGKVYLKKNYGDRSVREYQEAVSLHPLEPSYREDLGMALYVGGKLPEAAAELHKATKLNSKNADYFRVLGFIYDELGNAEQAVAHFRWALHLSPQDAHTQGALGRALVAQGLSNLAVDEFKKALALDPSLTLLHLALARALATAGRTQEAVQSFRQFAQGIDSPDQTQLMSRAFLEMGQGFLELGEYGQAAEVFQAGLQHPEEEAAARVGLAKVSLGRSDMKSATSHVKRALALEPHNSEVWQAWSLVAAEEGNWDEAIARMERAISNDDSREEYWIQLGRSYRKAKRFDEADEAFAKGMRRFPESQARFLWLRGRLAVRRADNSAAYEFLRRSLELAPGSWKLHEDMALACLGLQNWQLAEEHIRSAVELAPESKSAGILELLERIPS